MASNGYDCGIFPQRRARTCFQRRNDSIPGLNVLYQVLQTTRDWLSCGSSKNRLDDALIKPSGQRETRSLPTYLSHETENIMIRMYSPQSILLIPFLYAGARWTLPRLMQCTPSMPNYSTSYIL